MKQASKETCEGTFERVSGAHSFFKAAVYFEGFSNMGFINTLSIKINVFFTISTWTLNHNVMLNILGA